MTLGSGSHIYEVVEGWGALPTGKVFGYTHGVVTDRDDNVYIHNQSKDAVAVFNRDGTFLSSWGEEFAAGAHGFYIADEGGTEYLYITDIARHSVYKTTLDGNVVLELDPPQLSHVYENPEDYTPTDVCVAPNGDIYVGDGYGMSWVHRYAADGSRIQSWGGVGSEPGLMKCPHGVWIDQRGTEPQLVVADRGNNRLQTFTLDGQHIGFVTYDLRQPCTVRGFGSELFIPDLQSRITILDENNDLITHLGDRPGFWRTEGWPNVSHSLRKVGAFSSPHSLWVDSHDDLYVTEWVEDGRVTKLRRKK
jgi:DNA-binding beta-propeller fold protein YncE